MEVRAYWVEAPGNASIRKVDLPKMGSNEVLVRTMYSGISRGTESLVFLGRVPETQHLAMRCPHQEGTFSFPVKYGYITVGVVEKGCGMEGQHVFCLHPHQTHFVVPQKMLTVLPDGLAPEMAVLAANLETAVNGVWDADPQPGERFTVIGAGVVGLLTAWRLKQMTNSPVEIVDINPDKETLASEIGLTFRLAEEASTNRHLIIHASGAPQGLRQALRLAAPEGRIIEMSWFGDAEVALPLGEAFHSRRLTIQCSQVGQIPPRLRDDWTYAKRMSLVLSLLRDNPVLSCLINGESAFDDLPQTMTELVAAQGVLCHRIVY